MGCQCAKYDVIFKTALDKAPNSPSSPTRHPELHGAVQAAASRLGKAGVSGRYHCPPRRLEEDYVLDDKVLGTGFNGDVLRARSRRSDGTFAVKAFRLHGISKEKMQVLVAETKIFLSMDHPHIARLIDVYEGEKYLHLVMECMEGGELFDRLAKVHTFSEADAATALWQMLLAVNFMHNRGVIHRDLKLENFLYEKVDTDHLKLIDFGFSHVWDPNAKMAGNCGTLPYAAPEVLQDRGYDSKCDLWSLGVVAFILLAGYMPFSGAWDAMVKNIRAGKWQERPQRWAKISGTAQDFVRKLLVVSPASRLSAADALDHPFIQPRGRARTESTLSLSSEHTVVIKALREFAQASRFRRAVMSLMAWSLTRQEMEQVRDAFLAIDESRQGTITMGELKKALSGCFEITDEQVKPIFDALDTGSNEEIYYSEFLAAMVSKRIAINEELLHKTFQRFDVDKSGYITVANLKEVLGDSFDGVDVEELIKEADFTHDGQVSLEEFIRFLKIDGLAACHVIDEVQMSDPVGKLAKSAGMRARGLSLWHLGLCCLSGCHCFGGAADPRQPALGPV